MTRRVLYVAEETNPLYLHALRNRFLRTPNVQIGLEDRAANARGEQRFDTVLCMNTLEYAENVEETLSALQRRLKPGGRVIALVPQTPSLYCGTDKKLGHLRRFEAPGLSGLMEASGLVVESRQQVNRMGTLIWYFFGKVCGRDSVPRIVLKIFDKTVWLGRRLDGLLPWRGSTLIIVARRPEQAPRS
jgi:SAM-dependent methyltransferase